MAAARRPHPPTTTSTSPTTGSRRWHPLNQSLYVGYKVMLAGLLMIAKGDRIAMNSSVETRYPFLDDDVIAFCASIAPEYKLRGLTEKWILRQVAARTLPAADRQPAQDDVPRQPVRDVPRPEPPGLGRPAPQPRVAPSDRLLRPRRRRSASAPRRCAIPRITPERFIMDLSLTCVVSTQLWHHTLLRRRPLRPARLDARPSDAPIRPISIYPLPSVQLLGLTVKKAVVSSRPWLKSHSDGSHPNPPPRGGGLRIIPSPLVGEGQGGGDTPRK